VRCLAQPYEKVQTSRQPLPCVAWPYPVTSITHDSLGNYSLLFEHESELDIVSLAFEKSTKAVMASHADSAHDLLNLPIADLRQYVELFPNDGLAKVITGYLSSGISRHPLSEKPKDAPDLSEGGVALNDNEPLTQEDCLVLMTASNPYGCNTRAIHLADTYTGRHTGGEAIRPCALFAWRLLSFLGRV
jgi:hypothetical protein